MKINSVSNYNLSKNCYINKITANHPSKEDCNIIQTSFKGSVGGATGVLAGEILAIGLKSLLGLTGAVGIVTVAALSMLGIGIMGERLEDRIAQRHKNN